MPAREYLACADVFAALDRPEAARAALDAGTRDLAARAAQIGEPAMRRSFLERVPAHREPARRTRELA